MKFQSLTGGPAGDLRQEYRDGRSAGPVTLGARHFFFRRRLTVYFLPYGEMTRYFRRVEAIPARIGCCAGEIAVENLVICARVDGAERELAQIQLPGRRAALTLMDALGRLAPGAAAGVPAS